MGASVDLILGAVRMDLFLTDQLIMVCIFAVLALSLNLINGWGRMFSLGHHGFFLLGAYGAAWCTAELVGTMPGPMVFIISCLAGALLAVIGGIIIGVPCLRLRGDYLAIATLGFGEGVRALLTNIDPRMPAGFTVPRVLMDVRGQLLEFRLVFLGLAVLLLVAVVLFIRNYVRSARGRAMLAVAQDETAAGLLGIKASESKVLVFVIGSMMAGLAGAVFAHYQAQVSPKDFEFVQMVYLFLIVVLGGLGSISGCIMATFVLRAVEQGLALYGGVVGEWRQVIFALVLILLMIFRPRGIFGPREINQVIRDWRAKRKQGGASAGGAA